MDSLRKEIHKINSIASQLQFVELVKLLDESTSSHNSVNQLPANISRIWRNVMIIIESINKKSQIPINNFFIEVFST